MTKPNETQQVRLEARSSPQLAEDVNPPHSWSPFTPRLPLNSATYKNNTLKKGPRHGIAPRGGWSPVCCQVAQLRVMSIQKPCQAQSRLMHQNDQLLGEASSSYSF